jgi:hypothetical protein
LIDVCVGVSNFASCDRKSPFNVLSCDFGVVDVDRCAVKRGGKRTVWASFKKWAAVRSLTGQKRLAANA